MIRMMSVNSARLEVCLPVGLVLMFKPELSANQTPAPALRRPRFTVDAPSIYMYVSVWYCRWRGVAANTQRCNNCCNCCPLIGCLTCELIHPLGVLHVVPSSSCDSLFCLDGLSALVITSC